MWLSTAAVGWGMGRDVASAEPSGAQVLRRGLLDAEWAAAGWSGAWRPLGDALDRIVGWGGFDLWTAATFLAGTWVAILVATRVASGGGGRWATWLAAWSVALLLPWGWLLGSGTGLSDLLAVGLALLAARWAGSWRGPAACAAALTLGEIGLLGPVLLTLEAPRRPAGPRSGALGSVALAWVGVALWLSVRAWSVPEPWGGGPIQLGVVALEGGRAVLGVLALAAALALLSEPRRPVLFAQTLLLVATAGVAARLTAGGSVVPVACALAVVAARTLGLAGRGPVRLVLAAAGVAVCSTLAWRESSALMEDRDEQRAYAIRAAAQTQSLPGALPLLDSTWPESRLRALAVPAGQAPLAEWFGAARPVWPLRTTGEPRPYVRRPNAIGIDPEGGARVVPTAVWGAGTPDRLELSEPATVEVLGSFAGRRLDALLWTDQGYAAARGPDWEAMGTAPGPGGATLPRFGIEVEALLSLDGGALGAQLSEARRAGSRHGYVELRWVDDARGIDHRPIAATEWIELAWGEAATAGPASP